MEQQFNKRRHFLIRGIKTALATPLLGVGPWRATIANTLNSSQLALPDTIRTELSRLYGAQSNSVLATTRMSIKAPDIAENGMVVPFAIEGDTGYVLSVGLFVESNPRPLAAFCRLHPGARLAMGTRVKMARTSHVYAIALTEQGLVGVMKQVKITIGCGGG